MNVLKMLTHLLAMKMLKRGGALEEMTEGGDGLLGGLRSMRALARSREIRRRYLADPYTVVDNYRDGREEQLNAQSRPPWGGPYPARTVHW